MATLPPLTFNLSDILLVGGIIAVLYLIYYGLFGPISQYPGPFVARFTDYWRFRIASTGKSQHTMIALHQKYGPIVRTGPKTLSIATPSYIQKIYGPGRGFHKSAFYHPFQAKVENKIGYNLFTSRDAKFHSSIKQPVADAYSYNAVTDYEPFVDTCIVKFVNRLTREFATKDRQSCDLGAWFQYYAFDVIAEMSFGQPMGFLDNGSDINNLIHRLDARLDLIAPRSQMPWVDWVLEKNPIIGLFKERSSQFYIYASGIAKKRAAELQLHGNMAKSSKTRIFIDRFLEAQQAHPDVVDDRTVGIYTTSNVVAGSDTVAITLRTIFYMLLRHPKVLEKLLKEMDETQLSFPVTWQEAHRMPYLSAVIQEALRIHPPVGFALERVVPAEGLAMDDGTKVPHGIQVGMNAWVVHLDPVFGEDPTSFIPERWLKGEHEPEDNYQKRLGAMTRSALWFGYGSRGCMGKHISYLEMFKLVPTLFSRLRFELCGGERKEWQTMNSWFVRQWDMDCYVLKI